MTSIIPMVRVHVDRDAGLFTVIPFACDPNGLSVTVGNFLAFGWEDFKTRGFEIVEKCLTDYHTGYKPGVSQFDRMSESERIHFFSKNKIGFQISEKEGDLWWISLLQPVGCGHMLPIGPKARVNFRPSQDADCFFDVLLQLMPAE